MKRYKIWSSAFMLACIVCGSGCDSVSMKEVVVSEPRILSFAPQSGSVGSEIVITGEYLDDVVAATIGGEKTEILQKVSDKQLSLLVIPGVKSGRITLSNAVGEAVSESDFTVEYPVPVVAAGSLPAEAEMGNKVLLSGSHLNAVIAVFFTAEGYAVGNPASILSQSENELLVRIPYVESDNASLTLKYFDGTKEVQTPLASAPKVVVKRYAPNVLTSSFGKAKVGDVLTLNGTYLNKIDGVMLELNGKDIPCGIVLQTESELRFAIPPSDEYADGSNPMKLKISYFDGREERVLSESFVVTVPFVYFWENRKVYAQGRVEGQLSSFFSPETGLVYANSDWSTVVDPVSMTYKDKTCSANNKPAVTESEYNSVNPYFFFTGASAGQLQINSPANSKSQLRNFYSTMSSNSQVTGGKIDCYGTPVLTFLWLDSSDDAHKLLIDEVKNGSLDVIDETSFPINVEEKTCRGFSMAGVRNAPNTDVWAPGVFSKGEEKTADVDVVLLVFYYNVQGSVENVAANIKRVGLLHIKTVDFKMYNNTIAPSSSSILFDMYWQKRDYDYSKVK